MKKRMMIGGGLAVPLAAVALAAGGPALSAPPPPPAPSNAHIIDVVPGAKTATLVLQFTPGMIDATHIYPTYNFSVAPKFCKWNAPSGGAFRVQTYAPGGPYQVSLECACNRTYTVSVASAPPDAYTPRSAWVAAAPVTVACRK